MQLWLCKMLENYAAQNKSFDFPVPDSTEWDRTPLCTYVHHWKNPEFKWFQLWSDEETNFNTTKEGNNKRLNFIDL